MSQLDNTHIQSETKWPEFLQNSITLGLLQLSHTYNKHCVLDFHQIIKDSNKKY